MALQGHVPKTPRSGKNRLKRFLSNRLPSPPLDVANRTSTRVFFHFNSASSHGRVRKRPQRGKLQLKNVCFSIGSHCPPMDMWEKHLEVANRTLKTGVFSPANPVLPKQRVFLHPNSMPSNAHVQKTPRSGQLQLKNVCFSIGSHCPPMDMWEKDLEVANGTLKKGVFSPATPVLPKERVFLHPNSMS